MADPKKKNMYYIDGNVVRRLEPERRVEIPLPEKKEQRKPLSREASRNQERELRMSAPFVCFLTLACVAMVFICIQYLQIQSSITTRLYNIENLEAELSGQKTDNKNLETKINTYTDLDYIYQVATEELGMIYPAKDQVVLYGRTESEYVRQYENIPE
ncbi:MAG: cell division protein FtsL [Lachnospiraceae bacterium]|nr:cell division protein FtsL [Lachnospiraceae bacterium]